MDTVQSKEGSDNKASLRKQDSDLKVVLKSRVF